MIFASAVHCNNYLPEHLHCWIFFPIGSTVQQKLHQSCRSSLTNPMGGMRRVGSRVGGRDGLKDEDSEDREREKTQIELIRPSAEEVSFWANPLWTPSIPLFACCRMCPRVGIHKECGPFCLVCDGLLVGGHLCVLCVTSSRLGRG